jgi:hypothetical protein
MRPATLLAAILLAQALPIQTRATRTARRATRGGYCALQPGSPRYLRGLGTRRGLDRRGLDRQTPNGIDLEIPVS